MPVMSYRAVSASMPMSTSSSLALITWIVSIASSNVMPAFFSAAYLGSAMSSNLVFFFRGTTTSRSRGQSGGAREGAHEMARGVSFSTRGGLDARGIGRNARRRETRRDGRRGEARRACRRAPSARGWRKRSGE
jgi:hypothetical protein